MARKFIDCREYPSEMNCTVAFSADSDEELLEVGVQHAVQVKDSPESRQQIRNLFKGWPLFEVTSLGLGEGSHTASLFPEPRRSTSATPGDIEHWGKARAACLAPLSGASIEQGNLFVVPGAKKRDILARSRQRHDATRRPPRDARNRYQGERRMAANRISPSSRALLFLLLCL
jgi:6-phosphogluconolactonase/glucosamine-6-phosphate isomerase/deaminase